MPIAQIPALTDNYIYILSKQNSNECIVIDPGVSAPVIEYCEKHQLKPTTILCTHHHYDHIDGVKHISDKYQSRVYCSEYDKKRIPSATDNVTDNEIISLLDLKIRVISCPGHTMGAITFYIDDEESLNQLEVTHPIAFTGDTLFGLGCGRLFEGTPEVMWDSLNKLKQTFVESTEVYCGHEYTLKNAEFAIRHAPKPGLVEFLRKAQDAEISGKYTVPTLFSDELKLNPFITAADFTEFKRLRALRNEFKLEP